MTWYKALQVQMKVREIIGGVLDDGLQGEDERYPNPVFIEKRDAVYQHMLSLATL